MTLPPRLAAAIVLVPLAWACSQPAPVDAPQNSAGEPCADARSQADQTACWTGEAELVRQQVAKAQQSLVSALSGDEALSAAAGRAHREWTEYRDAQCAAFAASAAGGSSEPLARAACEARLGAEREAEIARLTRETVR